MDTNTPAHNKSHEGVMRSRFPEKDLMSHTPASRDTDVGKAAEEEARETPAYERKERSDGIY